MSAPGSSGRRGPGPFVVGVIGLLIVAIVAGGAYGVVHLRDERRSDRSEGTGPAPALPTPSGSMPRTDPALARFYDQKLDWQGCGGSAFCADLTVPLDYRDPSGRTITVRVNRIPASGTSQGALVVNPGGPGGSGLDYARSAMQWPSTIRENFDRIGFDPRGVGASTPLTCLSVKQKDALVASDPDPETPAEVRAMDRSIEAFGRGCLDDDAGLARHMSTVEVAKDVDILRQALGQPRLDWFGASYGTFIGATYANLFPTRVGRMVLDGAVDPGLSDERLDLGQAGGFEAAFRAYLRSCVASGNCPLGDSVEEGSLAMRAFLGWVERKPLKTDSGRELAVGNAVNGIFLPLYVERYWPVLTAALKQATEDHDGTQLLALSDAYVSRSGDGYADNSVDALYDVNCLDHPASIPSSQVPRHFAAFEKASPTFGRIFAYSLSTCHDWPVKAVEPSKTVGAGPAKGAPPIVVVGTTRDPATPVAWARALSRQLDSGVLITRDGDGHTGYHQGNACVDDAVDAYLMDRKIPKNGLTC